MAERLEWIFMALVVLVVSSEIQKISLLRHYAGPPVQDAADQPKRS